MRALCLLISLAALTGCATDTRLHASRVGRAVTAPPAAPCPPLTDRPIERNLQVPFARRAYLLPSGALCVPRSDYRQPVSRRAVARRGRP